MGATIKVDRLKALNAFNQEAGKLTDGELSRYLPGFTAVRVVRQYADRELPSDYSLAIYLATRVRDGKTYGIVVQEWTESLNSQNPFFRGEDKVELYEIIEKTKTVSYYEQV